MQVLLAEVAADDPVLGLELLGRIPDRLVHVVAPADVQAPHVQVHRLGDADFLFEQPLVVAVMPGAEDDRRALVAFDQQAALVVGREVHRADHAVAPARAQPLLGGVQQRARGLGVVLALKPAEQPPLVVLKLVEVVVDVRADPPNHSPVAVGQEELGLGVLEERVLLTIQPLLEVHQQRRHPVGLVAIQPPGKLDEGVQLGLGGDRADL